MILPQYGLSTYLQVLIAAGPSHTGLDNRPRRGSIVTVAALTTVRIAAASALDSFPPCCVESNETSFPIEL